MVSILEVVTRWNMC